MYTCVVMVVLALSILLLGNYPLNLLADRPSNCRCAGSSLLEPLVVV